MTKILTFVFIASFISIVAYLNSVQTAYNPLFQLMSELALGKQGELMLGAFLSFACALISASLCLTQRVLRILMIMSALALTGAGFFKLGANTELHVALVAIAFILIVLTMYLMPRLNTCTKKQTLIHWSLGFSTALFVALGQTILPIGLAQRLATLCIFLWLICLVSQHRTTS